MVTPTVLEPFQKKKSILKGEQAEYFTRIYVNNKIDKNINCTEKIIVFRDYFEREPLREKWAELWKISILISISFKFLYDQRLSDYYYEKENISAILKKHRCLQNSLFGI